MIWVDLASDEGWVYQDEKDDIKLHSIAPENVMIDFNEQVSYRTVVKMVTIY